MSEDILDKLNDLYKQATTERSHHYVASCCKEAILTIIELRREILELQSREVDPMDVIREYEERNS